MSQHRRRAGRALVVAAVLLLASATTPSEAATTLNRAICDAHGSMVGLRPELMRCGATFPVVRGENGPKTEDDDVEAVYRHAGTTAKFYADHFGVDLTALIGTDAGDGRGKALRALVDVCVEGDCPARGAFWNGEQANFGTDAIALDVVAHEFTHGVTQHSSGLIYRYDAGAINEALSNIFGEYVELAQGTVPQDRWLFGQASKLGVLQDMADPPRTRQPDRLHSPDFHPDGDVHVNAGVANKTAYLINDGGRFNGQTVRGLGDDKGVALWWTAQNLLTSTADYAELGRALTNACAANARGSVAGTTAADCHEVAKALAATEIAQPPEASRW